jgi:tRNA dimethylallyltransferase
MNSFSQKKKVIVILGPTASGKSDLTVQLARQFNGEIMSADSRQVYRGMDLGTGKITKKEMRGIPHHLLDVASPKSRFSAARYKKLASATIKKIRRKNKLPIICGGTGFYIDTLTNNLTFPAVKPDHGLRAELEKLTAKDLYKKLRKLDSRRAKNIDRHNCRRLVRALEIVLKTGRPVPPLNPPPPSLKGGGKNDSPPLGGVREDFIPLFLGIKKSHPDLSQRIKMRLKKRLKKGMVAEVKKLRMQGVSWKKLESFGLEYRWLASYLQKKISYDEMVARLQKDIEHYAKRQMTWFKKNPKIIWVKGYQQSQKLIKRFLKE